MGLAVTGCINDGRTLYNGSAVILMPSVRPSGNYKRLVTGERLASGIKGQTTSQTLGGLAVAYSGRFDEVRYYSGDTAL